MTPRPKTANAPEMPHYALAGGQPCNWLCMGCSRTRTQRGSRLRKIVGAPVMVCADCAARIDARTAARALAKAATAAALP
jgi:hypothetical protein